ncbi:hypothetical protein TCAL_04215 [Tigriopus californicus]|uniref:Uncharacterized protein n=1 Tax=Tigriopus californicus TaxID=6832 RepID=A0A553N8E5_TIGCA|nr:uncharacterized protein LOC131885671 isoform X2 [Tigriopus californicus]TRY61693.1 hypothetical protein TCAL_04215 [Tigriopus californicus]
MARLGNLKSQLILACLSISLFVMCIHVSEAMNVPVLNQRRVERAIRKLSPLEDWGTVLLKRQEAVLQDPRFVNCMGEADGPEDPNFMSVFAKCYSFSGRPRFGKRSWKPFTALKDMY